MLVSNWQHDRVRLFFYPDDASGSSSGSKGKKPSDCKVASVTATASAFDKDPVNKDALTKSTLSATSKDPANCNAKEKPQWSWEISKSEYRVSEDDTWATDGYKPEIDHPDPELSLIHI